MVLALFLPILQYSVVCWRCFLRSHWLMLVIALSRPALLRLLALPAAARVRCGWRPRSASRRTPPQDRSTCFQAPSIQSKSMLLLLLAQPFFLSFCYFSFAPSALRFCAAVRPGFRACVFDSSKGWADMTHRSLDKDGRLWLPTSANNPRSPVAKRPATPTGAGDRPRLANDRPRSPNDGAECRKSKKMIYLV